MVREIYNFNLLIEEKIKTKQLDFDEALHLIALKNDIEKLLKVGKI